MPPRPPDDAGFFGLVSLDPPPDTAAAGAGAVARFTFEVVEHLCRIDGLLYGGAAIGASLTVAEAITGRPPQWMTTQFVASVERGATVTVTVEVLASGRRTAQVRVSGTAPDGSVVFASLGATGALNPDGLTGSFDAPPTVSAPNDAVSLVSPFRRLTDGADLDLPDEVGPRGFGVAVETRQPRTLDHPDPGAGRECLWLRRRDGGPLTPAVVAYLADLVPSSVARAAGKVGGGTSLDNTFRVGRWVDTEWVLLDLRPHFAVGGYGTGTALLWSEAGDLLATASQTASMVLFDPATVAELLRAINER